MDRIGLDGLILAATMGSEDHFGYKNWSSIFFFWGGGDQVLA